MQQPKEQAERIADAINSTTDENYKVTITIEQRHVDGAQRKEPYHCPVARAMQERMPYGYRASAGQSHVFVDGPNGRSKFVLSMPLLLIRAVRDYDVGDEFVLGTYELKVVTRYEDPEP